jgi:hypothetical protein
VTVPAAPAAGALQATLAAAAPGPIQSAVLAAQAYIYGYPLMEYQRVRQTVGTVNTVYSLTSFANPGIDPIWLSIGGGKRPNVDTFYSLAELDLSQGPVVLYIPDMGSRYFSFHDRSLPVPRLGGSLRHVDFVHGNTKTGGKTDNRLAGIKCGAVPDRRFDKGHPRQARLQATGGIQPER